MNEFSEYQDSLNQYQDTSMRTEQEAPQTPEHQQEVAENNGLQFSTTHNSDGEIDVDFENTDNTTYPVACLLYTSPSPRDATLSRMPSSA